MGIELAVVVIVVFAGSAILTGAVRKLALSHGVLDIPNQRSSHRVPTPRGGGVAIVVASTAGFLALRLIGVLDTSLFYALLGALAVAGVGFLDDRRPVPSGVRLAVHLGAASWALYWLGGMPAVRFGADVWQPGAAGNVLGVLVVVWILNFFNFMDGIDGLAASEAVFVSWAGALLGATSVLGAAVVFGGACCGFLVWNRPPARIFMGDVGSGFLGYVLGVFVIASGRDAAHAPWVWLILGGVFFVDATVTLIRRAARGERVYEAHRSHAYQWQARRFGSHARVTTAVVLLNLLWVLPCAYFAWMLPESALRIALGALVPLAVLVIVLGAGRRER